MIRAVFLSSLLLSAIAFAGAAEVNSDALKAAVPLIRATDYVSRAQEATALNAEEKAEAARLRKTREVWIFKENPEAQKAGVVAVAFQGKTYYFGAIQYQDPKFWKGKELRSVDEERDTRLLIDRSTGDLDGFLSIRGKLYAFAPLGRFNALTR